MQRSITENQLIVVDIADRMLDYVSLQPDIDETKIKSAALIAQNIDLKRLIGKTYLDICLDPQTELDEELTEMLVAPLCYFTFSRLLKQFQGTFTESGLVLDAEATNIGVSKAMANENYSIAEVFVTEVMEFIEENYEETEEVKPENLTPKIRKFGGQERRASN